MNFVPTIAVKCAEKKPEIKVEKPKLTRVNSKERERNVREPTIKRFNKINKTTKLIRKAPREELPELLETAKETNIAEKIANIIAWQPNAQFREFSQEAIKLEELTAAWPIDMRKFYSKLTEEKSMFNVLKEDTEIEQSEWSMGSSEAISNLFTTRDAQESSMHLEMEMEISQPTCIELNENSSNSKLVENYVKFVASPTFDKTPKAIVDKRREEILRSHTAPVFELQTNELRKSILKRTKSCENLLRFDKKVRFALREDNLMHEMHYKIQKLNDLTNAAESFNSIQSEAREEEQSEQVKENPN